MFLQDVAPILSSPWADPKFLLSAGGVLVLVAMAIARLEFKTNANGTRQKEFEGATGDNFREARTDSEEDVKALREEVRLDRADTREWKKEFYKHATDTKVHHNEEMFKEFRAGIDRRFSGMESTLGDINHKLDRLADK